MADESAEIRQLRAETTFALGAIMVLLVKADAVSLRDALSGLQTLIRTAPKPANTAITRSLVDYLEVMQLQRDQGSHPN